MCIRSPRGRVKGMCLGSYATAGMHYQVRHSWECHERYSAVLIGSLMMLSVYMPRGGYDGEDFFTELELVEEGKRMGVKDFPIGGDLNIGLKLETDGDGLEFKGLDSLGLVWLLRAGMQRWGVNAWRRTTRHFDGYNCCVTLIA